MAKQKRQTGDKRFSPLSLQFRLREGLFIVSIAVSLFLLLALLTYHRTDPGWSHLGSAQVIGNAAGRVGAIFADIFLYFFGYFAYLFPVMIVYSSWLFFLERKKTNPQQRDYRLLSIRSIGFLLLLITGCGLASLHDFNGQHLLPFQGGGILGDAISQVLIPAFNYLGTTILLFAVFLVGITLITGLSWVQVMDVTGRYSLWLATKVGLYYRQAFKGLQHWRQARREAKQSKTTSIKLPKKTIKKIEPTLSAPAIEKPKADRKVHIETTIKPIKLSKRSLKERQGDLFNHSSDGMLPALSLLDQVKTSKRQNALSTALLEKMSREVEEHLNDFGVDAQVVAVHPGPVITRFELQLAPGVKVNKITALAKDLARSLSVVSVRIVEVIPGKSVVGLELPNTNRETVLLSEVLSSQQYEQARSPISIALGKDIAGSPVVVDLSKMPHLLVAGTTGSGKSVSINAMLMSLLYKATPEQVRMIMIDPKMLELSIYEGIPHLLTPVVVDMKEAANALRWCVAEMDRRYRLMASLGVRNLAGYNQKIKEAEKNEKPIVDPFWQGGDGEEEAPNLKALPFIVVIVDEFADMMMVVGKKVEQLIARIAQKARAAGIHMILATQRPSVDVITGLIKANVPTRIAFHVSSRVDSRTIIDQQGAEQLLGHGDMLYLPPGSGLPVRIHGAFVADHEVHNVVEELRKTGEPNYLEEVLSLSYDTDFAQTAGSESSDAEADPLYDKAVQIVIETRRASISSIQRRLKIGYNRAARLVEQMEAAGLVSPMEGNGSREVLIPENQ